MTRNLEQAIESTKSEVRKYDTSRLVQALSLLLHESYPTKPVGPDLIPHWRYLLLMKWSLRQNVTRPQATGPTKNELSKLLGLLSTAVDNARLPSEYDSGFLFMKTTAFQQFWLQQRPNVSLIGRQAYLFTTCSKSPWFGDRIKSLLGLDLDKVLQLSLALTLRFVSQPEKPFMKLSDFGTLAEFTRADLVAYFSSITKNRNQIRAYLRSLDGRFGSDYELLEMSPLREFPLLSLSNGYLSYGPQLLFSALSSFVYNTLKRDNPSAFMNRFGKVMECYVAASLDAARLNYANEDEVGSVLPAESKLVDFIVADGSASIFIDAKGTEMAPMGRATHRANVVSDKLRNSLLKGLEQALVVSNQLADGSKVGNVVIPNGPRYAIVVTYNDMYVGNGNSLSDFVARKQVEQLMTENPYSSIPLNHVFFLSLDDLDSLCAFVRSGNSVSACLEKFSRRETEPSGRFLIFRQHLRDQKAATGPLPHIDDAYQTLVRRVQEGFGHSPTRG